MHENFRIFGVFVTANAGKLYSQRHKIIYLLIYKFKYEEDRTKPIKFNQMNPSQTFCISEIVFHNISIDFFVQEK